MRLPLSFLRSGSTTAARLAAVGMLLGVMAIGARRLNAEQFGLWAIFYGLMNFATAMDFGFRYSLGNRLAALKATEHSHVERCDAFLTVFHLEMAIGIIGLLACLLGLSAINWARVFHIHDVSFAQETQWLFPLVCGLLMLNQPFMLAGSAFFADHQIELASALAVGQSIALLASFWLGAFTQSFSYIVLIFFGSYLLTGALVTVFLFYRMNWRWHWPPISGQVKTIRSLARQSFDFFVLSAAAMAASTVGPLLAGMIGNIQAAGDFALIQRFFNLLVTIHLAALTPLAPAYTLHARQGDWEWVRQKLRYCVRIIWPLLFVLGGVLLFAAHPLLLRIWSGHWLSNYWLAGLLALSAMLAGWANTYSIVLNSLGAVRLQAVLSLIMLVPVIVLPLLLGRYLGTSGIALASSLCLLPACLVNWNYTRSVLNRQYLRV